MTITIGYEAVEPVDDIVVGIAMYDTQGRELFGTNTDILGVPVGPVKGAGEVVFNIDAVPFLDGTYSLTIGMHSVDEGVVYDWSEGQHHFEVMYPGRTVGIVDLPVKAHVAHTRLGEKAVG